MKLVCLRTCLDFEKFQGVHIKFRKSCRELRGSAEACCFLWRRLMIWGGLGNVFFQVAVVFRTCQDFLQFLEDCEHLIESYRRMQKHVVILYRS